MATIRPECSRLVRLNRNAYSYQDIQQMNADGSTRPRRRNIFIFAVTASLILIAAISILRLNWFRVSVRKYEMSVAFNGKAPWGDVGAELDGDPAPTVLYRKIGRSYCYTAFQSPVLSSRVKESGRSLVNVEYNVFSSFGHEGRYTLRSVDGVLVADGNRVIKDVREFGGQVLLDADEPSGCP
ncbi:hypothetical protein [Occallatibacter riparius]|uniref:Uncharacterized protein n=1 Tax=Occallatibacter riparius TaxID=1002689 RepID=A0A9J7BVI3_9BACT|nr:hypothetical protein [Occallatibacter riparius]UWZ85794.1 hypothetical protein MOP44_07565 [Occallatibacter riparius]